MESVLKRMSGHTDYYLVVHMYSAWVPLLPHPLQQLVNGRLCLEMATSKNWPHRQKMVPPPPPLPAIPVLIRDSPVCRQTAESVIPSSTFIPLGDDRAQVLSHYKSRCTETPCKYFERSKSENIRRCPYLNNCRFEHVVDGQKFTFTPRDIRRLKLASRAKKSPPRTPQKHSFPLRT